MQRPTLVIAHNKTLAHQLYGEFKELFPDNAIHYFVSYYDYYQPEAYVPSTDTYIEKDSLINEEIDRMRHAATFALLTRRDVLIVASVSCIYGIGAPEAYLGMKVDLAAGVEVRRDAVLRRLVEIQYERNDIDFPRGTFRVRGDVVEIFPAYEREKAIRIEWWGDEIETISEIDPLRGKVLRKVDEVSIFPGSPLRHPGRRAGAGHDRHQGGAARAAAPSCACRTSWSRSSGWSSARCTTSRCSSRWAAARASRTTRATCRAGPRASRRPR